MGEVRKKKYTARELKGLSNDDNIENECISD